MRERRSAVLPTRWSVAGQEEPPLRFAAADAVAAFERRARNILAQADDAFLAEQGMTKGAMQLVFSPEEADALYAKMGPGPEVSGGSAANTLAGIAALGGKTVDWEDDIPESAPPAGGPGAAAPV